VIVCEYLCVYVYMFKCVCICVYVCAFVCFFIFTCGRVYARIDVYAGTIIDRFILFAL